MHEILDCLEEINLDNFEYCTLVEKIHHSSPSYAVYVPKLMGGISHGTKNSWSEGTSNIFLNSDDCKVAFGKTVKLQNYLTVPRFEDTNFSSRADINGYLHPGIKFILQSMYGNPKDIHLDRMVR